MFLEVDRWMKERKMPQFQRSNLDRAGRGTHRAAKIHLRQEPMQHALASLAFMPHPRLLEKRLVNSA